VIVGAHFLVYSRRSSAEAVRAWMRDVARLPAERSIPDWPLFALGPAELAVHPSDDEPRAELYLICDDIERTVAELEANGGALSRPVSDEGWGLVAWFRLPDGGELPVYEPRHATALALRPSK
jgi:hypothetical protein